MHQDATMPLGMEVGFSPGDFVLDGDPAPSQKGGGARPQFSAHVYCDQTAGWIKVALVVEVGLGRIDIVLDGDTAPLPKKGTEPPIFGPSLLWPNGWMHQDATWYRQSEKYLLSSNMSSTCPHNMANFGPLAADIDPLVWGTPANFNGFCVLAA